MRVRVRPWKGRPPRKWKFSVVATPLSAILSNCTSSSTDSSCVKSTQRTAAYGLSVGSSVEETDRRRGYGAHTEDLRVGNRWKSEETVHGRLHICIRITDNVMYNANWLWTVIKLLNRQLSDSYRPNAFWPWRRQSKHSQKSNIFTPWPWTLPVALTFRFDLNIVLR